MMGEARDRAVFARTGEIAVLILARFIVKPTIFQASLDHKKAKYVRR